MKLLINEAKAGEIETHEGIPACICGFFNWDIVYLHKGM